MCSSSEDEVDVLLHGTPDQKRKLIRECLTGESESSSEDEFEKEMEAELNSTIKTMEDKLSSLETGKLLVRFSHRYFSKLHNGRDPYLRSVVSPALKVRAQWTRLEWINKCTWQPERTFLSLLVQTFPVVLETVKRCLLIWFPFVLFTLG